MLLFQDVEDLKYLNESHLDGIGVRLVQKKKLKELIARLNLNQTSGSGYCVYVFCIN
jgi:hypothetical protein